MITLGIDTCEARGSVALRQGDALVSLQKHESTEDYSSWLLPAVETSLRAAGVRLPDVELLAVATGPGSFTGVRIGLTVVKAWAELYHKPLVGVSRLEVIARTARSDKRYVAASFDAQRGQVFGGLYQNDASADWKLIDEEMVIAPNEFVRWVSQRTDGEAVAWVSLDPEFISGASEWRQREAAGDLLIRCEAGLAAGVADLGEARARKKEFTDALQLDANYVRRSDAEIFWKDPRSDAK